jgi:hypothetical protein
MHVEFGPQGVTTHASQTLHMLGQPVEMFG